MKPAHHSGTYLVDSRRVRAIANANPLTLCWRCRRTLDQHAPHHNGKPARWTAGHTQHGSPTARPLLSPPITQAQCEHAAHGDYLAPEASTCNYGAQATDATERIVTTRRW